MTEIKRQRGRPKKSDQAIEQQSTSHIEEAQLVDENKNDQNIGLECFASAFAPGMQDGFPFKVDFSEGWGTLIAEVSLI